MNKPPKIIPEQRKEDLKKLLDNVLEIDVDLKSINSEKDRLLLSIRQICYEYNILDFVIDSKIVKIHDGNVSITKVQVL